MSSRLRLCGLAASAALLWALPACGGDDDVNVPDSGSGTGGDAAAGCPVEGNIGPFEPLEVENALHFTQEDDPAARVLVVASRVDDGDSPPADLLSIQLWDGFGAFAGGQIATGEFAIEGDEANLRSCGVCVSVLGDAVQTGSGQVTAVKQYIATGGTVTIESAGDRAGNDISGNFTGSVTGLTLVELAQDKSGNALAGGCETAIESASWDAPIINGDDGTPPDGDAGPAPVDAGAF